MPLNYYTLAQSRASIFSFETKVIIYRRPASIDPDRSTIFLFQFIFDDFHEDVGVRDPRSRVRSDTETPTTDLMDINIYYKLKAPQHNIS
jgi:hypothetical protein